MPLQRIVYTGRSLWGGKEDKYHSFNLVCHSFLFNLMLVFNLRLAISWKRFGSLEMCFVVVGVDAFFAPESRVVGLEKWFASF